MCLSFATTVGARSTGLVSEMMYYLRTFPNNNPLVARWIRAAVFGAARNLGGYHIRIIRNSYRFEHFANSHAVAANAATSCERTSNYVCRWEGGWIAA